MLWTYFFPAPKPAKDPNANVAVVQTTQDAKNDAATANNVYNQQLNANQSAAQGDAPNKSFTVKTPLYEAKFDSLGAVATHWTLLENVSSKGAKPLYSGDSTKDVKHPLELISEQARSRREVPLKIITGDSNFDSLLNDRNYQVSGAENAADGVITLIGNESKKFDFTLRDEANQLEVVKSITLRADSYLSDLQTKITRNGQPINNAKLLIGASIGDQGIKSYSYYAIESEGVAAVDGSTSRNQAVSIAKKDKSEGTLAVSGAVDWAGVGDTYFAMAAIPNVQTNGLEFRASAYDFPLEVPRTVGIWGFVTQTKTSVEVRHLLSALVPIATDGATTKLYVGSKDHFLLTETGENLTKELGRPIDLDNFISYGFFYYLTRPIATRIVWVLNALNTFTNSYGIAILVFTVLFYSVLFPVRWFQSKSFKKAAKNAPKMKEMQTKMEEMKKKNIPAEDPRMRELQMEQLKLTKDAVPIGGCLPLLLQFPLLISLYIAITISLDFRQASFLWLPDLSAGDPFHLLEFLFAGSMFFTMLVTPQAAAITPEQQMQQKMMMYFMPFMMLFIMWSAPAGLLIYWLTGNIIGFGQQMLINKLTATPNDEPPTGTAKKIADRPMTKKERLKTGLSTAS